MKECSAALKTFLDTADKIYKCDLYEITLGSTVLRYADYDMPIVWNGHTWACTGPLFSRGKTRLTSKIEVDKMAVTVSTDATDLIGTATWQQAAQNGVFDEAPLTLYKCYMSAPGVVVDALEWFGGYIDVGDGGGLEQSWSVKSHMQKLNVDFPSRKYYPTCPYAVYDADCGLDVADFTATGTITAVTSKQEIQTNLTFLDGYYDLGGLTFTSGPLTGVSISIKNSYATNGRLVFIVSLDSLPVVGNTFAIYPGCARTPAVCDAKFNNLARNRSTPFIPLKETII